MSLTFEEGIVRKPWGYEYLMYRNDEVGVWFLHIDKGQRTSLHCHPQKNTGLILLAGRAEVSFLKDSRALKGLAKIGIRRGTFHSTRAVEPESIAVIEVEHPCVKEDLVRFDDEYGRDETAYESGDAILPLDSDVVRLPEPGSDPAHEINLAGCRLSVQKIGVAADLRGRAESEIVAFLAGGLVSRSGQYVVNPGDVLDGDTLDRLARKFRVSDRGAGVLSIRAGSER